MGVLIAVALLVAGPAQSAPCLSRPSGSVPAAYRETVARLRALVCERLAPRIPRVQVAVAIDGTGAWAEGFGDADAARRPPGTRETQVLIGRLSEPLTAAARGPAVLHGN